MTRLVIKSSFGIMISLLSKVSIKVNRALVRRINPDVPSLSSMRSSTSTDFSKSKIKKLKRKKIQVYSFGHSGANVTQYLAVYKNVARVYRPDLTIVLLIHNDFMESFEGYGRVDNSTLQKDKGTFSIVGPRPASTMKTKRRFRNFALIRYLVINLRILKKIQFIRDWYRGDTRKVDANVSIEKAETFSEKELGEMLNFNFKGFVSLASDSGGRLIFAINPARFPEDIDQLGEASVMSRYNDLSRKIAENLNLPFLDLTPAFRESWEKRRQWHKWHFDSHWNLLGHQVAAEALSREVLSRFFGKPG